MQTEINYKDHVFQLALLENCTLSGYIEKSHDFYELQFLESLAELVDAGEWVLDAGAHIGNHALFFAKVLGVNTLAIEPNPKAYQAIKSNIKLNDINNQIIPVNRAISDVEGDVLLTPRHGNDPSTFAISDEASPDSFRCKTVTLDSYIDFFKDKKLKMIKLDVEGSEAIALQTGEALIDAFKPIVTTEVESVEGFHQLADFFQKRDYVPVSIHNPSPMVVWKHEEGTKARSALLNIFGYGIQKALDCNVASRRSRSTQESYVGLKEKYAMLKADHEINEEELAKLKEDMQKT